MEIKVLLCKNERKRIVTIQVGDDVRYLKKLAVEVFNLAADSSVTLEYYDTDFDDWIEAEDDYNPSDKEKFNVVVKKDETMPVQGNSLESNASECDSILRESEKPTEEPQSDLSVPEDEVATLPLQDVTNKCAVSGPVQESAIVIVEGAEDKDIPSPFPFPPHYPPAIEVGLKLKDLQPLQQANFYTRIANVMLLYKRYPTKTDFENVAREVGVKYPFLKSPLDPVGHIVKALRARFREFRRNKVDKSALPANVKIELALKKRATSNSHSGPKCKKIKLDTPPSGEDEASFARHNQKLKSEHTKVHPNKAVVQELMRVTFEMRRNDIVNNAKHVAQITEEYPFLKSPDELLRELARVIHSPDLEKEFVTVWREKMEMLLKLARKNTSPKVQKVIKELDDLSQEDISDSLLTVKILSILPFIIPDHKVKPAPERLLTTIPESLSISAAASEIDEAAPTLIVKESFEGEVSEVFLVSEKVVLCKIDPPKSPLFLFAAFYAFNMQYPKGLVSLYTFLEIFLFNKRPKKIPSIVSSILSCLNTTN